MLNLTWPGYAARLRELAVIAGAIALIATPSALCAQGLVKGVQEGAAAGNKAAGPVGGVLGGAIGGVVGVFTGVLGVNNNNGNQAPAAKDTSKDAKHQGAGKAKDAKPAKTATGSRARR